MAKAKVLIAALMLIVTMIGWSRGILPPVLALGVGFALVIWGFNLDWRRKKANADARAALAALKKLDSEK